MAHFCDDVRRLGDAVLAADVQDMVQGGASLAVGCVLLFHVLPKNIDLLNSAH